jgi:hypothetical protein
MFVSGKKEFWKCWRDFSSNIQNLFHSAVFRGFYSAVSLHPKSYIVASRRETANLGFRWWWGNRKDLCSSGTQIACSGYSHCKICSGHIWAIYVRGNGRIRIFFFSLISLSHLVLSDECKNNSRALADHIWNWAYIHTHVLNIFRIRVCWIISPTEQCPHTKYIGSLLIQVTNSMLNPTYILLWTEVFLTQKLNTKAEHESI